MIKHSVLSIMTELIAEMLFMLFSIYSTVQWVEISEHEAYRVKDYY